MHFNPITIIKAILRKIHWVFLFPAVVAAIVFYMQKQKPREYQSGMVFYTGLVSGVTLTQQGEGRTDYFAVNTAFDNLMTVMQSRETLEEVAMRLLATHLLMKEPNPFKLSAANHAKLHRESLPEALVEELTEGRQFDVTLERIRNKYRQSETNVVIEMINVRPGFYNVDAINGNLTVRRKRNSDMLEVLYRSSDPGVCYLTLNILAETFVEKNRALRNYEASGIIEYFRSELQRARDQLNEAEERLKEYSQENQVINYSEQTKYLAASKEELERDIYLEQANADASAEAIRKLEQSFDQRERLYVNSRELLRKRDELAAVNTRIASALIMDRPEDRPELAVLRDKAAQLEQEMYALTEEFGSLTYTRENIPRQNLISQWLANILELDKSTARLDVLIAQRDHYDQLFDQFAPIGFNLSKMEREIDIAEREYLSILHGLNQARIRQSDFELFGTLELLDLPFFPLNPQSTRTRMLVAAAFLASLVFVAGLIVGLEVLDRSIRTPAQAESFTGLEPIGALATRAKVRGVDREQLNQQLFNLLRNKLIFTLRDIRTDVPPKIIVYSTQTQSAIVDVTLTVAKALQSIYNAVYCLCEDKSLYEPAQQYDTDDNGLVIYAYNNNVSDIKKAVGYVSSQNKAVVIQLPGFEKQSLAEFLRIEPTMGVLVVSARQTWDYQDKKMLSSLVSRFAGIPHRLVVCETEPDNLDQFLAEVPRKRSFLRKWVKKMIKLNF